MTNKQVDSYNVVECFESINGEGVLAGQLAVFIRFKGCNLACSYCDTAWANENSAISKEMTADSIHKYIKDRGIRNVTLTGGEPLLQANIYKLLKLLASDESLHVEIETNGSVDLSQFCDISNPPSFTMDYKLPDSGMESKMCLNNFELLEAKDCVKFVAGSQSDLNKALEIIKRYNLTGRCRVFISAVFGKIEPAEIVDFMIKHNLNGVNLQLQLHKFIWDPNMRGV